MASPDLKSPPVEKPAVEPQPNWSLPLAIIGTLAGAALGVLAFWGLYVSGFYAIMLPGLLAGLCGGYPLKKRVIGVGIFAAIVSLVAMLLTEWWFRPFLKDESLTFFLTHLGHLKRAAILMMVLGVAVAFWFGMGRDAKA
jgi:hypothetical protein